ncbi:VOC family protein [Nemorincola caseinilytica]|uniref:VOC family protein n=1 Tax=Nemorincola caseinilytica TaxID=2054315 RepID=A0ABP8NRS9_9BACT
MANRVIHFEIQADDVMRAKTFYEKCFDWKIDMIMTKEKGGMDYWGLNTGPADSRGINGGLYQRPADNKITTFDCTLEVDDIDAAIETVKANGGTIQGEKMEVPGIGWAVTAYDTEGNRFGMLQPASSGKLQ